MLSLPCPAKLNLFLHITGRRPDGYHHLQTLFQLLNTGDTLTLSPAANGQLSLTPELQGVPPAQNLIIRAALALQQATGCTQGAAFNLHKTLPMGGGLGGGSSNAASALVGLNHLWRTGLSLPQLAEIGQTLGADIPVFVLGHTAWAEGIGEQLTPVTRPQHWYLVLTPPCSVPTAKIFQHEQLTRNTPPISMRAFIEEGGKNDCQPLVEALFPEVKNALDWLNRHSENSLYPARLTGTGASIFQAFKSKEDAQKTLALCPKSYYSFLAQGVNQSPLHLYLRTSQ